MSGSGRLAEVRSILHFLSDISTLYQVEPGPEFRLADSNARAQTVGAGPKSGYEPKYLITRLKLLDVSANRFNPPCYVTAEYLVFWFEQSELQADQERVGSHQMPVSRIDRGRMNFDQDLIVIGSRFVDLFQFKNVG